MNYKRIFKSQKFRFFILRSLSWFSPSFMLKCQYWVKLNRSLNLKNPERFSEKVQRYKINYKNQTMCQCVDKYLVRDFIKSRGCEQYLNDLYGVYEKAEEINFAFLPDKFVIKTTNGSGGENILICKEKAMLDVPAAIKTVNSWKSKCVSTLSHEWAYIGAKTSRIIIEKYLEEKNSKNDSVHDYKFFCFDGKVKFLVVDVDRYIGHKRNFYTVDWELLDIITDCPKVDRVIPCPDNYDEMVKLAEILSFGFPFVRVDLYNVEKKVIFGEMTFYPWSGYIQFYPDAFDIELGSHFKIA